MSKNIIVTREGGMVTITLNRPYVLNALTPRMFHKILQVITELKSDDTARVVIITGAGRGFCSGTDLEGVSSLNSSAAEAVYSLMPILNDCVAGLKEMPKATIACVNGVAAGCGFNLALACDIIIASENARFVQTYLGVPGLHVDGGGSYFLPRAVGIHKACELLFTGRMVDAKEAERLGMVNMVVKEAQLMSAAKELARQIMSKASVALGLTKIALWKGLEVDLRTALEIETRGITLTSLNEDSKEGARSFVEKRKPIFTGKWPK
jgi:2-(1,2-epoxy-1,2-dihydrophenyl)acetyl-CoA isomerase